ncbi:hypothetical protein P9875_07005 [Janthinobacterium rivuli]|uniref:HEAT repeat domain-containing protein n=1 Tax=Janthinobacterium rivuli TaxID=2751478 RepID=A0ABY8I7K1_9BURK|nr:MULTISPECIES: hypothetical protein [Janthinobacterium]WFR80906.1 hypothetical protein P9875_07005 [Janthinobacterium rivuli]
MKKSINSNILDIIKKGRIIELENLSKPSRERILEKEHLDEILKQLNQKNSSERKKELLWLIALKGDKSSEILRLAKRKIYSIRNFGEYPIISRSLNYAIYYALCKTENNDMKNIANSLLENKSGEIRLLVAEFYLHKKQIEKSIEIIIKILDEINIDHNIANAIDMDVASCADIEILKIIKDKYINSNSIITDGIKHVISVMETAISNK